MEREYDEIISVELPDPILREVETSVLVESNYVDRLKATAEYDSRNKLHIDIDLFEQYIGDEKYSDVSVVKYSIEKFAPALSLNVRLKTPNYYRGLDISGTGLADPFEGCRFSHKFETGSYLSLTAKDESGIREHELELTGARKDLCAKTFMYCTSVYLDSGLLSKRDANAVFKQDYTHGSIFRSSKELAQHILKIFAERIRRSILGMVETTSSRSILEVAEPDGEESLAMPYAWIVHGPVSYLQKGDMGIEGIESYFTKPDIYRNQNEYRFWCGFSDTEVQSDKAEIFLPVPMEIVTAIELE